MRLIEKQEKYQQRLFLTSPYETVWEEITHHIELHQTERISLTTFFNYHRVDFHQNITTCLIVPTMLTSIYHNHDFYELNVITQGPAFEYIEGSRVRLDTGDVLFLPLSMRHCMYLPGTGSGLNVLVSPIFLDATLSHLSNSQLAEAIKKNSFAVFHHSSAEPLLSDHLIHAIAEMATFDNTYKETLIQALLLTYENEVASTKRTADICTGRFAEKEDINTLFEYMQAHLDTVDVEELCDRFHYSRSSLYRHIKKHTGYGFSSYISVLRYNRARYLLKNTTLTNRQIATRIGFSGAEQFCRFFRKQAMATPQEFRKQCQHPEKSEIPDVC